MTERATSPAGPTEPGQLVQRFVGAINAADDHALTELLHEDFVDRTPNPLQGTGREAFVDKIHQLRAAFSNLNMRVEQVVAEGDRVTFLWTLTGTNDGSFADGEPTGINVEFGGMNLERVSDGTIVEHWSIHDALSLFHQLGRLG
jgi:predicted ester cyclase